MELHRQKKLHDGEIFFFAVSDVSDHFGILDFVTNFFSIHFSTLGLSFFPSIFENVIYQAFFVIYKKIT